MARTSKYYIRMSRISQDFKMLKKIRILSTMMEKNKIFKFSDFNIFKLEHHKINFKNQSFLSELFYMDLSI